MYHPSLRCSVSPSQAKALHDLKRSNEQRQLSSRDASTARAMRFAASDWAALPHNGTCGKQISHCEMPFADAKSSSTHMPVLRDLSHFRARFKRR